MKMLKYITLLTISLLAVACTYDDTELEKQMDDIKVRIEKLKKDIDSLNDQLSQLNELSEGNPITSVVKDSEGNVIITYIDNSNEAKTVVLAQMEYMVSVPILGVKQDSETSPYYWTIGEEWLMKNGERVPVSGYAPDVSVDAEGYWTIDGVRIKDANGNDLYAHDGESCLFKFVDLDENGDLVITQGNGNIITIPVQSALNLTVSAEITTQITDATESISITYELTGLNTEEAIVAIAEASDIEATIDREAKTISVTFPYGFTSGYLVVVAHDLEEHTVIRPVFFSAFFEDDGSPGIRTAADLVEFANLVNTGQSYEKFQDEAGGVNLLRDIDMSSVVSWTPIGYASCPAGPNDAVITGNAFAGRFSGNNFKIKNLRMVASGSEADMNYGLFGTLAPGATVENLVIDSSCSLEVTATARMACGVIAGYVYDATVRDVHCYAKMTFNGRAGDAIFMSIGVIGQVYCENEGVTVDSVNNYGELVAYNSDNIQVGATTYHGAGIVGFAHAFLNSTKKNTISSCVNYGNMNSHLARTSGIVAAANRNTEILNCSNEGDQINSFSAKDADGSAIVSRLGNITCIISNSSSMTGCTNYGNLISTTSGRCGGITCLPNEVTFINCANYGEVLTDSQYRGLFYAYNGGTTDRDYISVWKNCTAAGKLGKYNNNAPVYDSYSDADKTKYLGIYRNTAQKYENINYFVGTTDPETGYGEAEYNILFIGNSFTKDAVEHMPGLLAGAGNKKVNLTHIYYGGQYISTYNAKFDDATGFTCYTCKPGLSGWSHTTGISIKDCCYSAQWDVVTIQEHTGNMCAWNFTSTSESDVKSLISKINSIQKTTPEYYYIMSQAYNDMSKIGSGSKPYITWTDQVGMYNVIVEFAKKMMDTGCFKDVIATGTMLQNLRTTSLNNELGLSRDGYHMDLGISRYGASCMIFEKIITPKYNTTMDENTFRYSVSNDQTTPVTDANVPIAIQAARYAIENPFEITDMSKK